MQAAHAAATGPGAATIQLLKVKAEINHISPHQRIVAGDRCWHFGWFARTARQQVSRREGEYRRQNSDASGTLSAEVSCLSVNRQTEARELIIGCAGLLFVALLLCALKIYRSRHAQKSSQQRLLSYCCVMFFTDRRNGTELTSAAGA